MHSPLSLPGEPPADDLQIIIDALSAHIAILDPLGTIITVNRSWKWFADNNGSTLPGYGIGMNYITLCEPGERARTHEGASDGRDAAKGIRAVLNGASERFQLTYPCHSPTEQRWYLLTATPVRLPDGRGVVVAHENVTTIVQREEAITAALQGTISALSDMAEVRDPYTSGHQQGVARLATAIARQMGLDSETRLGIKLGAQIHDIGKIGVPAEILSRPGRLAPAEFELIRTHCQVGHDIVKGIPFTWPIAQIVLQHHERMDGSGYPNGLVGDQIRMEARIVAIADVVDAVSSHRPYRPSRGISKANELIREGAGVTFDRAAADAYFSEPVQRLAIEMYRTTPDA